MFLANLLTFVLPLLPEVSEPRPTADLLFAGDAMMHEAQIAAAKTGGTYDFDGYFDAVKPYVESADFAVVNFEASLGGRPHRGYPCFSAPDEYATALSDAGFDFFLLANNHILDRNDRGLHRTIATLDSLGIPHTGIFHNKEDRTSRVPAMVNVKGFSLAILNYTYGTNGFTPRGDAIVDYIDTQVIESDIKAARKAGAELVAVCIHWGDEYKLLPNAAQKSLADKLTAMGADMIIGGHPHVVQPMEMRCRADGSKTLLVYSLGNFISNMKTDNTRGGAMVRVHVERDSAGNARVGSAAYSLVFTEAPSAAAGRNFRLRPAHAVESAKAKVFRNNAERIFSAHNAGVEADTLFLKLK